MKKKSFIIITAINIAALLFVLFSYYIKKHTGYALYNFAILFFLDWQMVLVYDEQGSLQNVMDEKKYVQEGRFYVLYKAKKCFYMCAANR
ncbi:MAG: hypothetical protein K6E22_00760 [Treponema sp.]|nr:hypothetical protein [Treponema sp.]